MSPDRQAEKRENATRTGGQQTNVGEEILIGDGEKLRVVAIGEEIVEDLLEQGLNGVFTVGSQRLADSRDGLLGWFASMKGRSQGTSRTMLSPCDLTLIEGLP